MIDTHIINIKKTATFYIVGHPEDISSLLTYTDLHFKGVIDNMPLFMDRLLFQELYCYIKPQSFLCRPLIWIYKRELMKAGRWIDFDSYIAAYYVAYPEYAMKDLPFTLDEVLNVIISDNPWIPLFDVDGVYSQIFGNYYSGGPERPRPQTCTMTAFRNNAPA